MDTLADKIMAFKDKIVLDNTLIIYYAEVENEFIVKKVED